MNEFQRRIGVGARSHAFISHQGGTRRRPVIVEEGARRGTVGGFHTDHWDGRVDATVHAPSIITTTTTKES